MSEPTIDDLLHDADRAVCGAEFAFRLRDYPMANRLKCKAINLYTRAMARDPSFTDPAWQETGNRDRQWLRQNDLSQIAEIEGRETT